MAITSGFFNSLNGDRKYNAEHMSHMFDGIIRDGIHMHVPGQLMVSSPNQGEMVVHVAPGRSWFNHVWILNDAPFPISVPTSEITFNRIDTVVLDINSTENVRAGTIKIVSGYPATNPVAPTLIRSTYHNQYPLADIFVGRGVNFVTQANISNRVGTSLCPWITGPLETMNIDALIAKWGAQWNEFMVNTTNSTEEWSQELQSDTAAWVENYKAALMAFKMTNENEFIAWFNNLVVQLDGNVAGNLQNQINELIRHEFERFYSLINQTTDINKTLSGGLQNIITTSDEAVTTVTMTRFENVNVITIEIVPRTGGRNYTKKVTITKFELNTTINESFVMTFK